VISSVDHIAEFEELLSLIDLSPHHGAGGSHRLTNLLQIRVS